MHWTMRAAYLCLAVLAPPYVAATDYWTQTDQEVTVTTYESAGYTESLARDLARFNKALTEIVQLPEERLPARIYELPPEEAKGVVGESGVSYQFSGYEVIVVTTAGQESGNRYWGALFGYTGSLFLNGRASRSPYWFQVGVPELFARTEFTPQTVRTGNVSFGNMQLLMRAKFIPLRSLLRMQQADPQLQNAYFDGLFEAESWYLAYQVYVQGKYRQEFFHYLAAIRDGKPEEDAFKANFNLSYEELDQWFANSMKGPAHLYVIAEPEITRTSETTSKLSVAESKATLAELNLHFHHRPEALRLAEEALRNDHSNELALRVKARALLEDKSFRDTLLTVDTLEGMPSGSPAAWTDVGDVLSRLRYEVAANHLDVGITAEDLGRRAQIAYQRSIGEDPRYLKAWGGLAYLFGSQRNVPAAQEFAEKAEPVMEAHLNNGALARALATMCAQTGQAHYAFLYGEYWRDDALTPKDQSAAVAFLAQLHKQ
jgi:hypothetical protein